VVVELPPPHAASKPSHSSTDASPIPPRRRPIAASMRPGRRIAKNKPASTAMASTGTAVSGPTGVCGPPGGGSNPRAVVVTVTVLAAEDPDVSVRVVGDGTHVAAVGALVQLTVTVPANPPSELTVAAIIPDCPAASVSDVGETSGAENATPVPESPTVCGLSEALSVAVTEALRAPVACGVNVTLMVQLAPAATDVPQVLVWAKSLMLVPVTATLVRESAALPELVSVTVCAVLVVPTN
jgi:hypothetical protein